MAATERRRKTEEKSGRNMGSRSLTDQGVLRTAFSRRGSMDLSGLKVKDPG
jgi:hypothetical protein